MKKFKELQEVDGLVAGLYAKDKKLQNSKFGYAYKKFSDKFYFPVVKELQERIQDVRVDNAMEDKNTKEILVDKENVRGYKYTKEGLLKCMKEERA
jgi:MFS superfamily sulfate permease-like transporter